jgi:hypothetical protein
VANWHTIPRCSVRLICTTHSQIMLGGYLQYHTIPRCSVGWIPVTDLPRYSVRQVTAILCHNILSCGFCWVALLGIPRWSATWIPVTTYWGTLSSGYLPYHDTLSGGYLLNQTEMLSTAESKEYWAQETYMQGGSPLYCTYEKPTFLALHFYV